MPDAENEMTALERAEFRALFVNDERDSKLAALLLRPPKDPERVRMLDYLNELPPDARTRFRDIYGLDEHYLPDEDQKTSLVPSKVRLDELDEDAFVEYTLRRAATSTTLAPKLVSKLAAKFEQVAVVGVSAEFAPILALPDKAPRLWSDRDPGMKPAEFLRAVYATWIEAGVLTRTAIKDCDPQLYSAYSVRVHRHPEEAITFATSDRKSGRQPEADGEALIERRRTADREAKAFKRQQAKMSHLKV